MNSYPPRFRWRSLTSVLLATAFLILVLSGTILFISPPGRVANWTNWTLLGLRKHDWIGLHTWFSALFLVGAAFHLVFNWRPMANSFKSRITRRFALRWEWLAALAICGGVWAGTRGGIPPFSTLLAFSEKVKESWDKPVERAPIPHAELLTLAELAQKAGVELAAASNRLATKGITNIANEIMVRELADQNARSAQQIYHAILAETLPSTNAGGQGHGQGRGGFGSGAGGGASGGPGRKTLTQFCADEGIRLEEALARLKARNLKASADLTLREIAVNNGFSRPFELIDVIRNEPASAAPRKHPETGSP